LLHPDQVIGVHLTGMIGTAGAEPPFTPAEQAFIAAGERFFKVERWIETDVGGHFLEWEEPELVARELQTFFGTLAAQR
jgi:hypothetical protein